MRVITFLLLVLIVILGISFAVLNAEPVTINYYIGQHKMPLSMALVLVFALGVVLGLLVGLSLYVKVKCKQRCLKKRLEHAEQEITNLRAIPIKDNH